MLLLEASAVVITITVRVIMGEANVVRALIFRVYEPLTGAAILYPILTFLIVQGFRPWEAHRAAEPPTISAARR